MIDLLPLCSVIRFPFDFRDGNGIELKRFIVAGHVNSSAILIKTTSRVEYYRAQPDILPGVIECSAGEFGPFELDTIIDPANAFAVPHENLKRFHRACTLDHMGTVPELRELLIVAIGNNKKIGQAIKAGLLQCLQV